MIILSILQNYFQVAILSLLQFFFNDIDVVNFLIENGADLNQTDQYGVFPLQRAIKIGSIEDVTALIKTGKIDFTKRIKIRAEYSGTNYSNTTYLHLAAMSRNKSILSLFLDQKMMDVNVIDDFGDTALMTARRYKRKENIEKLFDCDDLDFLHINNKGEDALRILGVITTTKNKNEYRDLLLNNCLQDIIHF